MKERKRRRRREEKKKKKEAMLSWCPIQVMKRGKYAAKQKEVICDLPYDTLLFFWNYDRCLLHGAYCRCAWQGGRFGCKPLYTSYLIES